MVEYLPTRSKYYLPLQKQTFFVNIVLVTYPILSSVENLVNQDLSWFWNNTYQFLKKKINKDIAM